MIFGTQLHRMDLQYFETCGILFDLALLSAEEHGDQPQGLANLTGLSAWVRSHISYYDSVGDDDEKLVGAPTSSSPALEKM